MEATLRVEPLAVMLDDQVALFPPSPMNSDHPVGGVVPEVPIESKFCVYVPVKETVCPHPLVAKANKAAAQADFFSREVRRDDCIKFL
jgi:hypothetical protein